MKNKQPMETCFNYYYDMYKNNHVGWFSSNEVRWINRIRKLKEQFPDQVIIRKEPDNNDNCIYVSVPQEWLKIIPPRKLNLTDDQREQLKVRLSRTQFGKE